MAPQLPYQKRGKDFLASSHFTIGMDDSFLGDVQTNSHKLAYPPKSFIQDGIVPAKSLGDSSLMHVNSANRTMGISQTKESFTSCGTATREWNDYSQKLNTNFKNHKDGKCTSFETTAQAHFQKENAMKFDRQPQKSLMVSQVCLGDDENLPTPQSEVRANFGGQSVDHIVPNRYPETVDYGAIDTLKTDRRSPPTYATTNKDLLKGEYHVPVRQQLGEAAMRRGAHSIGLENNEPPQFESNAQAAYTPQEYITTRYSKAAARGKILGTTFLFGSEAGTSGTLNSPNTTANHFHTGASFGRAASLKPDNVFRSDFPAGDRHPDRVRALQNDTSYAEHFPVKAPGVILNPKVRGEDIITRSQVVFGKENEQLTASTASCYVNQINHIKPRVRVDQLVKWTKGFSLGAENEYRDPPTSEIKDNFKNNEDFPKFLPPSTVLRRLKDSHLQLSQDVPTNYRSTYNHLFEQKTPDRQGLAPKLQTSSIPLGNFSRFVPN